MDLQLILRVVWRFRLLVGIGFVLATALAVLSFVRVELVGFKPAISYRESEQWESLSTLFVTSQGFPWGSLASAGPDGGTAVAGRPATGRGRARARNRAAETLNPAHLTSLAGLYVRLSTSDPVLDIMRKEGPVKGQLQAFPVESSDNGRGDFLPMVTLSAIGGTPRAARDLAARHTSAFTAYLTGEQRRAGIPSNRRVVVEVVRQPQEPVLLMARKKTRPIVIFVAIMIAVLGLAFALENLRPRVRVLPDVDADGLPAPVPAARRSA